MQTPEHLFFHCSGLKKARETELQGAVRLQSLMCDPKPLSALLSDKDSAGQAALWALRHFPVEAFAWCRDMVEITPKFRQKKRDPRPG